MTGHAPPHSLEAERNVLGAVLFNQQAMTDVEPILGSEQAFHDPVHQRVYAAMLELSANREAVDMLSVQSVMRKQGTDSWLDNRGGIAYLSELSSYCITGTRVIESHAKIVRDKWLKRRLMLASAALIDAAARDDVPFADVMAGAHSGLLALADEALTRQAYTLKQVLHECHKALDQRWHRKSAITGVPCGIGEFDELTGGWQPSSLNIWAGRPGMGKTAAALDMALHAAESGHSVLVFSVEMPREELGDRVIASEARIDGMSLRSGFLVREDWSRITRATARIAHLPILIDDAPRQDLVSICARARRWRQDPKYFGPGAKIGLIVLDYLQLVQALASKRHQSRERDIAEISAGLKALAKELKVPILALASLNRECDKREDKRPMPSDLRDSGSIESDADTITFIYRDEVYRKEGEPCPDKGLAEWIISKHRGGPTGTVKLRFVKEQSRFESLNGQRDAWSPS